MQENKIFRNDIPSMEFENMITKSAKDYVEKRFGEKETELKAIVHMEMSLDPDDPDDEYKKTKFLNKMRREHERDVKAIKEVRQFLIHDASGNLVPYIIE